MISRFGDFNIWQPYPSTNFTHFFTRNHPLSLKFKHFRALYCSKKIMKAKWYLDIWWISYLVYYSACRMRNSIDIGLIKGNLRSPGEFIAPSNIPTRRPWNICCQTTLLVWRNKTNFNIYTWKEKCNCTFRSTR